MKNHINRTPRTVVGALSLAMLIGGAGTPARAFAEKMVTGMEGPTPLFINEIRALEASAAPAIPPIRMMAQPTIGPAVPAAWMGRIAVAAPQTRSLREKISVAVKRVLGTESNLILLGLQDRRAPDAASDEAADESANTIYAGSGLIVNVLKDPAHYDKPLRRLAPAPQSRINFSVAKFGNEPKTLRRVLGVPVQAILVAGAVTLSSMLPHPVSPPVKPMIRTQLTAPPISNYELPSGEGKMSGGGGGGKKNKLPASPGKLPQAAPEQIAPPAIIVLNEAPRLAVPPTVVMPKQVQMKNLEFMHYGVTSKVTFSPPSDGMGSGGGIGDTGDGGGVGNGTGPGVGPGRGGGIGGGVFSVGGGVTPPEVISQPDPDYSEPARQANLQGKVILSIIIGADGRPQDIKVVQSLGKGLDEKAMEAVRRWRFKPALKGKTPVAVGSQVEVQFRLY